MTESCCSPIPDRNEPARLVGIAARPPIDIRPAGSDERPAAEALVAGAGLPLAGIARARLLVAALPAGRLAGVVGLEAHDRHGLLRSLAVAPAHRGHGLGRRLVEAVENLARSEDLETVGLLTDNAAGFFARLGYAPRARAEAPEALRRSAEWDTTVCPTGSTYLEKDLRAPGGSAVHDLVRRRYAEVARQGSSCCPASAGDIGYDEGDLARVPAEANLGLGCGAPLEHGRPLPGETVLDLGSGGGLDALLAWRAVGPSGRVIGVDMTEEMIARARAAAGKAGATGVEFRLGRIEQLPVADASVDLVISNCVINLAPDKPAVFAEVFRVLRPGGRMVVADVVAERDLPDEVRADPELYCACVGGAARKDRYLADLRAAGFTSVEVLADRGYGDDQGGLGLRSVTVRAMKP